MSIGGALYQHNKKQVEQSASTPSIETYLYFTSQKFQSLKSYSTFSDAVYFYNLKKEFKLDLDYFNSNLL